MLSDWFVASRWRKNTVSEERRLYGVRNDEGEWFIETDNLGDFTPSLENASLFEDFADATLVQEQLGGSVVAFIPEMEKRDILWDVQNLNTQVDGAMAMNRALSETIEEKDKEIRALLRAMEWAGWTPEDIEYAKAQARKELAKAGEEKQC